MKFDIKCSESTGKDIKGGNRRNGKEDILHAVHQIKWTLSGIKE